MKEWLGIVVHHSASDDVSATTIDEWHKTRGFREIGYHFVIRQDGSIEPARSFESAGAHAKGRNTTHLVICLTGHFGKHSPTLEQLDSLTRLVKGLMNRYNINIIERHHEECPGEKFPWWYFIAQVKGDQWW